MASLPEGPAKELADQLFGAGARTGLWPRAALAALRPP